jgi:hypothetical protein
MFSMVEITPAEFDAAHPLRRCTEELAGREHEEAEYTAVCFPMPQVSENETVNIAIRP